MNLHDVLRWDPDEVGDFGDELGRCAREFDRVRNDLAVHARFGGTWHGAAYRAAVREFAVHRTAIAAQSDSYRRVGNCAHIVAPRLRALHTELATTRRAAAEKGLVVTDDGAVHDAPGATPRESDRAVVRVRIAALLARADDLDHEAASVLARELDDAGDALDREGRLHTAFPEPRFPEPRFPEPRFPPPPVPGTAPHVVATWWNALDETERAALLAERPSRIGALDGIPGEIRDAANRALLEVERRRLDEVATQLQAELDTTPFGGLFVDADAGLEQTVAKLAALDALDVVLAQDERRLLTLDLSGREAMAVVAVGDVDTADHVAVYTPGAGSTLQGNLVGYDTQVASLREEAQRNLGGNGGTVAAVTWLNYQAPQWGWGLAFTERSPVSDLAAQIAAPRLSGFLDGLGASRADAPNVTAVGHSYGALVTGLALQQGADADAAVFVGAPGIGTDDVRDLGLPPGAAYLVEARWDAVADTGTFGGDPSFLDGLTHLPTGAGITATGLPLAGVTGHSSYLEPGTTSSHHIAAVISGAAERNTR